MNIVLIPCWKRDDFLSVTLEHIKNAKHSENNFYLFCLDRGYNPDILKVINDFSFPKEIRLAPNHNYHGNSYNLLEGYKRAVQLSKEKNSELIYMIEEDIWIAKDFFDFHLKVQEEYHCFAVSAVWCHIDYTVWPDEKDTIYCYPHYQSLGVSFRSNIIENYILPHCNKDYYSNMKRYVTRMYPRSHVKDWVEQDGLINRVMEKLNDKCLYPYVPRAFHAGYTGYNRPGEILQGTLEERVAKLKSLTAEDMNNLSHLVRDIRHCDLNGHFIERFSVK